MSEIQKKPGFGFLGLRFTTDKNFDASVSRLVATIDGKIEIIKERDQEILQLREENRQHRNRFMREKPFVDPSMKDPEPLDTKARREYVATVAGFHRSVLAPKLLYMIGTVRAQLEQMDSTVDKKTGLRLTSFSAREFDWILKGTLNALWLIQDWGESMVKEQTADNNVSGEDIQTLKEIIA